MPCRSDYMEPNQKEQLLQETAQLLIYVRMNTKTGVKVTEKLKRASQDIYCRQDYVPELCAAIRAMTEEEQSRIIYDGRNPNARKLADWWDKHQEADRKRIEQEQHEREREELREAAIAKLTPEEREVLGI